MKKLGLFVAFIAFHASVFAEETNLKTLTCPLETPQVTAECLRDAALDKKSSRKHRARAVRYLKHLFRHHACKCFKQQMAELWITEAVEHMWEDPRRTKDLLDFYLNWGNFGLKMNPDFEYRGHWLFKEDGDYIIHTVYRTVDWNHEEILGKDEANRKFDFIYPVLVTLVRYANVLKKDIDGKKPSEILRSRFDEKGEEIYFSKMLKYFLGLREQELKERAFFIRSKLIK